MTKEAEENAACNEMVKRFAVIDKQIKGEEAKKRARVAKEAALRTAIEKQRDDIIASQIWEGQYGA